MRSFYQPRQDYQGDGTVIAYTFDFKIETLQQLLVLMLDPNGVVLQSVRGDDTTFLQGVVYDSVNGGGTVTLLAALPNTNMLILLEANDAPTQPNQFAQKFSFTLKGFEMALDYICGAVQRLAYICSGAVRLHDAVDPTTFDARLPANILTAPNQVIAIDPTSRFFVLVPNANNAVAQSVTVLTAGQAAAPINGGILDSAVYSSGVYTYEIVRGTTIFSTGKFSLHFRSGAWELVIWSDNRADATNANGVTLSLTGSTIAQVNAAVAADGNGNGTIKLQNFSFTK